MRRLRPLLAVVGFLLLFGCGPRSSSSDDGATPQASLQPIELTAETKGVLLTWVDEQGDFHVVTTIGEVPEAARAEVRVVRTDSDAGTGSEVFVADLRAPGDGGRYAVRTMSRSRWDAIGADRRAARMEARAPSAVPSAPPAPSTAAAEVEAVVYGADWCKPCKDAQRHLKRLGVHVTYKDVDEDPLAQRELREALRRAGRPDDASIPVIAVGPRLLVGFSPTELDRAVRAARESAHL